MNMYIDEEKLIIYQKFKKRSEAIGIKKSEARGEDRGIKRGEALGLRKMALKLLAKLPPSK